MDNQLLGLKLPALKLIEINEKYFNVPVDMSVDSMVEIRKRHGYLVNYLSHYRLVKALTEAEIELLENEKKKIKTQITNESLLKIVYDEDFFMRTPVYLGVHDVLLDRKTKLKLLEAVISGLHEKIKLVSREQTSRGILENV